MYLRSFRDESKNSAGGVVFMGRCIMVLCEVSRDGFVLSVARLSAYLEYLPGEIARRSGLSVGFVRATV
jgi:hypothetical protein